MHVKHNRADVFPFVLEVAAMAGKEPLPPPFEVTVMPKNLVPPQERYLVEEEPPLVPPVEAYLNVTNVQFPKK